MVTTNQPIALSGVAGWDEFVSDHEPYIAAVCSVLAHHEITVTEVR